MKKKYPNRTLIEVIKNASQRKTGITFIHSSSDEILLPYNDLFNKALYTLHNLSQKGIKPGDEVIIQVSNNIDFLQVFWACILGRIIPVPVSIGRQEGHKYKLFNIWKKLNNPFLVCDQQLLEKMLSYKLEDNIETTYRSIAKATIFTVAACTEITHGSIAEINGEDIAYIQFSSGSTGDPKGVILTHENLVVNITDIANRSEIKANDKALSWLPLTHDMGLICFHLSAMLRQINQYLLPTTLFIRKPLLWLNKTSEHKITQLYSPNFGYQYILSAINSAREPIQWDLKHIRIIYNGAEPISSKLCYQFLDEMKKYGINDNVIYPGYGLAEACVAVSLPKVGKALKFYDVNRNQLGIGDRIVERLDDNNDKQYISFAEVGYPLEKCKVRICDDTDNELKNKCIGHIQIKGGNVTEAYYNDQEVTNSCKTKNNWHRTGDLGFMYDESLIITGRAKNLIIINGQNIYPQDIEGIIYEKLQLKPGSVVACGARKDNDEQEKLIVFLQHRKISESFIQTALKLKKAVLDDINLEVTNVIAVKSIPKTTSGKVQYYQLSKRYIEGEFDNQLLEIEALEEKNQIITNVNEPTLEEQLLFIAKSVFKNNQIKVEQDFFQNGFSSLMATALLSRIHKIGYQLSIEELFKNPSIQLLTNHLKNNEKSEFKMIPQSSDLQNYPLISGQKRFWMLSQLNKNASANIASVNAIHGAIELASFTRSIEEVVLRHDSLRSVFELKDEEPSQRFLSSLDFNFKVIYSDLSKEKEAEAQALLRAQTLSETVFDLSKGPLLKVELLKLSDSLYYFVFVIHHIICDGWSIDVISKEIQSLYKSYHKGETSQLTNLSIQYKDYLSWFDNYKTTTRYTESKTYWNEHFSSSIPRLQLPFERQGQDSSLLKGHTIHHTFSKEASKKLRTLCSKNHVTTFTGIIGILSCLLHRYTGQGEFVIGTDTAGRIHQDLESQVGYYLNLLALKINLDDTTNFTELLKSVNQELLKAYTHQAYPFEELVDDLGIERKLGNMPLFDILVLFQNFENVLGFDSIIDDVNIESKVIDNNTSLNDLLLEFKEESTCLHLSVRYNTGVFTIAQMHNFIINFEQLLESVLSKVKAPLTTHKLLNKEATDKILTLSCGEVKEYSKTHTNYIRLFESQVVQNPEAISLVYKDKSMSYLELNNYSNQLANYLQQEYKITQGTIIGLITDRSFDMVISMLAVLKLGCVYVPIDKDYPLSRINHLITDSHLEILISSTPLTMLAVNNTIQQFILDYTLLESYSISNLEIDIVPEGLAYIMYTSGTTGLSKGVQIQHSSLLDYVYTFNDYFSLNNTDILIQQSSLSFDTSVEEIYPILSIGGKLVLTKDGGKDVERLLTTMITEKVSVLSTTPLVLQGMNALLTKETLSQLNLRIIISGGDILRSNHIDSIPQTINIYNTYGPTEGTVCTSYHLLTDRLDVESIGKPIANRQIYILNQNLELQPNTVIGELYLGGSGLSIGYLNQPKLTKDRFIENPLGSGYLYKTGDLGYWQEDGSIRFIGRSDNQLKIRGYRVEAEEVTKVILSYKGVTDSVVIGYDDSGIKHLVGYYTGEIETEDLRHYLREQLPDYMVPTYLIGIANIPMTSNAKIDYKQLPEPTTVVTRVYEAARNKTDELLIGIWEEVLGKEKIGIQDNFFELGGHSLKAVQIASRIQKMLSVNITLRLIFTHPELISQSDLIVSLEKEQYESIPVTEIKESYPLSYTQRRLWLLDQLGLGKKSFNLGWLCEMQFENEKFCTTSFTRSIEEVVLRHDSLRSVFELKDEEPSQRFLSSLDFDFKVIYSDLSKEKEAEEQALLRAQTLSETVFDLSKGPLLKVELLKLSDSLYYFVFVIHHIICDGWSIDVISKEIQSLYKSYHKGETSQLTNLPIQYKDYLSWFDNYKTTTRYTESKTYWNEHFSSSIPRLQLPFERQGQDSSLLKGHTIHHSFSKATSKKLRNLCSKSHVTTFTGIIGILSCLLHRYTGQGEFVIGTDTAGRIHQDLESQVGYYLNLLALKINLDDTTNFTELLKSVNQELLKAYTHQAYPFEELVDDLGIERKLGNMPLFDILVLFQNFENVLGFDSIIDDVNIESKVIDNNTSLNDLLLEFKEESTCLHLSIRYNTGVFTAAQMYNFIANFEQLLESILSKVKAPLTTHKLLNKESTAKILTLSCGQVKEYSNTHTNYIRLFESQVVQNPEAISLVYEDKSMSYLALNNYSNQLANYLQQEYKITQGTIIGLMTDRSFDMIISMLAVLKLGCVYVPIDKDYPLSRINHLITDSHLEILISSSSTVLTDLSVNNTIQQFILDYTLLEPYSSSNLEINIVPDSLAYIMYTSGTTGLSKGVQIQHSSLLDYAYTFSDYFSLDSTDTLIQQSSLSFDTSVEEIYPILSIGGKLVLTKDGGKDVERLLTTMITEKVSLLSTTPLVLQGMNTLLTKEKLAQLNLRIIISGGDILRSNHIDNIPLTIDVYNTYGPTEGTVCTSYHLLTDRLDVHSIGKPIANRQIYILNQNLELQPNTVIGELYLGGSGLSIGYLNQSKLTKDRFIDNPFGSGCLYKTGDLGYWQEDGCIRFIGRSDSQLKIRGYRVEAEEVTKGILSCKGVIDSVVVGYDDSGIKHLVGYYTGTIAVEDLRHYLREHLPDHMVPTYLISIPNIPMTSNAKVDYKELPEPTEVVTRVYEAARNETDKLLIGIWEEVLGKEKIGIQDNFFELGGHSLKAVQIASRIQKMLSVNITLRLIFTHPELISQSDLIVSLEKEQYESIPVAKIKESYPLSYTQRRLWLLDQLNIQSTVYNVVLGHWLKGNLNEEALTYAFEMVVRRHENLRTTFKLEEDEPRQYIKKIEDVNFKIIYENYEDYKDSEEELVTHIFNQYNTAFDLSKGPLLRVNVFKISSEKCFLFLNIHHIIVDEWSIQLLVNELQLFYNNKIQETQKPILPLKIQYKDFAVWQRKEINDLIGSHQGYWLEKLKGELTPLNLPTSYKRTIHQSFKGKKHRLTINNELNVQFQKFLDQHNSSLFIGTLSLVKLLLYRYTGQSDIIIGTPVSGRNHPDLENQIGFYLNTLVLRDELDGTKDFKTLLKQVRETCLEGYAHQEYPFDLLVEELDVVRDISRSPLFDVMVVMEDMRSSDKDFSGLEVCGEYLDEETSKFDLTFYFSKRSEDLHLTIEYNTDLYKEERIIRMGQHIEELLSSLLVSPSLTISNHNYLSSFEQDQLLGTFNDTDEDYPEGGNFLSTYQEVVLRSPNSIALRYKDVSLSYLEVDKLSNQLANYLRKAHHIKKGNTVGLLLDRSEWMLISMLGILKLGAIYLPIDKTYPDSRITYILEDGNSKILITDDIVETTQEFSQINIEELVKQLPNYSASLRKVKLSGEELAYMIYTSGSTGKPKGVQICHYSVKNLLYSMEREISANQNDSLFAVTTYAFDMSVVELYLPLHIGGTLIIAESENIKSPEDLIISLKKFKPSIMQATPGFWQMLVDAGWEGDKDLRIITGGEALSPRLGELLLLKTGALWNMYGPTETTVYSTYKRIKEISDIPYIGRPTDNMQAYILDAQLALVPVGITGTLYMGGKGIALGYQNKPELTSKLFIPNPFKEDDILYNTGDLCTWSIEGDVKYYGRKDHQLKIRGYRIEVEEVVVGMLSYTGLENSVVVGYELDDEKYLVGYYTGEESIEVSSLRKHLQGCLPEYMIPTYLVAMDFFPLTANGKIDKKLLPNPTTQLVREYVAPTNETERLLISIWEEILGKEHIGIKDNFFELGGHSLKGIQIVSRIHKELGVKIDLRDIFIETTLADLSLKVELIVWAKNPKQKSENNIKTDTIIL